MFSDMQIGLKIVNWSAEKKGKQFAMVRNGVVPSWHSYYGDHNGSQVDDTEGLQRLGIIS